MALAHLTRDSIGCSTRCCRRRRRGGDAAVDHAARARSARDRRSSTRWRRRREPGGHVGREAVEQAAEPLEPATSSSSNAADASASASAPSCVTTPAPSSICCRRRAVRPHALMLGSFRRRSSTPSPAAGAEAPGVSRYGMRARAASPGGSSPAKPSTTPSPRRGDLEAAGLHQTLDYLGESVATMAEADRRHPRYLGHRRDRRVGHRPQPLAQAHAARADRRSRHLRRQPAPHPRPRRAEFFVRIDMEDSRYTQVTLDVFETLWQQGYRNAGIVVQSCLPRSRTTSRA